VSYNPSISLQGLRSAANLLERAARNIAGLPPQSAGSPALPPVEDSFTPSSDRQAVPDYPTELIRMLQAKTHWRANLQALKSSIETERDLLDSLD
jgi:hypothetical protein